MSNDEFMAATDVAKPVSSGKARPESPKTTVMVLTEKPAKAAKGIYMGFPPRDTERTATTGRYDLVGAWCNDVYVLKGHLMTEVGGKKPSFAEPDANDESQKGKAVLLNGESYIPAGEPVEIMVPVGQNGQKMGSIKVGGVVRLEDVQLRAPALPKAGSTERFLLPVPNGVKDAVLIACSPRTRTGFFHIGPNAKTADDRRSHVGTGMILPIQWASAPVEGKPANSAPMMNSSIRSAMGIVVKNEFGDQLAGSAEVIEWAQQWQDSLKEEDPTAKAGIIVQLFRKPVNKDGVVLTGADATAYFQELRTKGLSPQQSFIVMASDKKTESGEWVSRTLTEAFDDLKAFQGENVEKFNSRVADKTNRSTVRCFPLTDVMDGGNWDIVCIPVKGWNVAPSIKTNVKEGKFDPSRNWYAPLEHNGGRMTEKGNVVSYNPLMGTAEIYPGAIGSFKPEQGESPKESTFMQVTGAKASYIEVLQMDGGCTMVDACPIDKSEVAVPLQWIITTSTPPEHIADITAQIDKIAVNAKAIQFGGRKVAQTAAPAKSEPSHDEPASEETTESRPPF